MCRTLNFSFILSILFFKDIEPRCGEMLCKLFPADDNVDLSSIVRKARKRHSVRRMAGGVGGGGGGNIGGGVGRGDGDRRRENFRGRDFRGRFGRGDFFRLAINMCNSRGIT